MPDTKKILGWGKCTIDGKNDIIEGSASLSVEEGEEQGALIEGGSAEGRKKAPDKYVLTYRLEQIQSELRTDPGSSIAKTVYSCGFNDISYFNRCFLKAYGVTPSAYRARTN